MHIRWDVLLVLISMSHWSSSPMVFSTDIWSMKKERVWVPINPPVSILLEYCTRYTCPSFSCKVWHWKYRHTETHPQTALPELSWHLLPCALCSDKKGCQHTPKHSICMYVLPLERKPAYLQPRSSPNTYAGEFDATGACSYLSYRHEYSSVDWCSANNGNWEGITNHNHSHSQRRRSPKKAS